MYFLSGATLAPDLFAVAVWGDIHPMGLGAIEDEKPSIERKVAV